jgi:hypothetical protein
MKPDTPSRPAHTTDTPAPGSHRSRVFQVEVATKNGSIPVSRTGITAAQSMFLSIAATGAVNTQAMAIAAIRAATP